MFKQTTDSKLRTAIRIGVRPSRLALKQAEEALRLLRGSGRFEIKIYETEGDKDKTTPIPEMEGSDFFIDSLEKALLNGEIDIAVHSAKDLPDRILDRLATGDCGLLIANCGVEIRNPKSEIRNPVGDCGLVIAAVSKSIDPYDVLVSKQNLKLDELQEGARIATCSRRRKEQLKSYRRDFRIEDIRGNIEERLSKLDNSDLDGIVLAAAGLIRLGLESRITQKIPFSILTPHPLQGSLALQTREDDKEMINIAKKANGKREMGK